MSINWDAIQKALFPLKDYEDCCRRYTDYLSQLTIILSNLHHAGVGDVLNLVNRSV